MIVPLADATDPAVFGGKSVALGAALRAGLPVPPGYAVSVEALTALAREASELEAHIEAIAAELAPPVATRSSAVGEDAVDASFAGQHVTVLNLSSPAAILDGLRQVYHSAHSEGAVAYRQHKAIEGPIQIAAAVQKLIDPRAAGVLFTRHPLTGADEFVIEAAWGLGEVVVQGMVTPDHYRLAREGTLLEERLGDKPIAIRCMPDGGTEETDVEPELVEAPCLSKDDLKRLGELAHRCEAVFGNHLDLEWAFAGDDLYLLQSRPITTRA